MRKVVLFIVSITLFLLSISSVYYVLTDETTNKSNSLEAYQLVERDQKVKPVAVKANDFNHEKVTSATIAAVGDILIHESLYKDAYRDGTFNFKPMFENVKPYLQQADISFANQETMLGGEELGLSGYPQFNSPIEVGDALKDAGVDIVSLANNHTLDVGERGILNAIDYYDSVGLLYTGAYKSENDRETIRTTEENNIVFSFLAYTYGTNGIPVPKGKDYLVNLIDKEKIVEEIKMAKEISDVVVLSLHFGNEYERFPNSKQKELVNLFTEAGASIILGHHPHVLQPFERVITENGNEAFVAYSLGNFISGQKGIEREIGGILQLEVQKITSRNETTIEVTDPRFVPVFTYKNNWRDYKLYELGEIGDDILPNANNYYENIKAHVSSLLEDLKFTIPIEK